jgi:hypothetical protein
MRIPRGMPLFSMKEGLSPIPYIERRALEWHVSISYPPYNAYFQLGQNSGDNRSWSVVTISFPFWMCLVLHWSPVPTLTSIGIILVRVSPLLLLLFLFLPLSL